MPPKKKPNEPSKKAVDKQKAKIIEDKTFGLKNKKGNKQQKFIQNVQKQVTFGNKSQREIEKQKEDSKMKKDTKKKEKEELNQLFKPVIELQKCGKGVDPKSVLCVFYKQGQCSKGDKCKFSHDMGVARKAEKRSLYDDSNAAAAGSGMADWDQSELEEVVNKRHGESNKGLPPTAIICKYFLDAVEAGKYGWFWECPNGPKCHYRHALPPGFVLKKDKKKMAEQKEEISLEELIETERAALGPNQTPVTIETFLAWKKRKREEKRQKMEAEKAKRKADFSKGRAGVCGREVFEFNPDMIDDEDSDEEGGVVDSYMRENAGDDEGNVREIRFDQFNDFGAEVSKEEEMGASGMAPPPAPDPSCDPSVQMNGDVDGAIAAAMDAVEIDENLFALDEEELQAMDEELDTLTLE